MLYNIFFTFIFVFLIYNFLSSVWLKRHPKYDITFIAAEIGAGKTCYAAKLAKQHLKKGWTVYSNDYIKGCGKINLSDFKTMCAKEKSLIIIDEASLEMNSRKFAQMSLFLIEYFKMSRHYKNKLILISQTFSDTDKQIRDLAAKIYFIRPIFADSFPGLLSMPVRVRGKLGINIEGQPAMQYKIGRIGIPYFLPKYYKYFKSFSRTPRPVIQWLPWSDGAVEKRGVAPIGGTPAVAKVITPER